MLYETAEVAGERYGLLFAQLRTVRQASHDSGTVGADSQPEWWPALGIQDIGGQGRGTPL